MSNLPTPLVDAAEYDTGLRTDPYDNEPDMVMPARIGRELERDCMTLALRLYPMKRELMSPECIKVMERWRPRVKALLEEAEK